MRSYELLSDRLRTAVTNHWVHGVATVLERPMLLSAQTAHRPIQIDLCLGKLP